MSRASLFERLLGTSRRQRLDEQLAEMLQSLQRTDERVQQLADALRPLKRIEKRVGDQGDRLNDVRGALDKGLERGARVQQTLVRRIAKLEQLTSEQELYDAGAYFEIVTPQLEAGRTLLGHDRLFGLWQAARNAASLPADPPLAAAEIGTYRGGGAYILGSALRHFSGRDWDLHVIDTFAGHPAERVGARDSGQVAAKFADTSEDDVRAYLSEHLPRAKVYRGDATSAVETLPDGPWGVVHLDVDLYEPTLACLRWFGRRLAPNGIIVLDDFGAPSCPGIVEAYEHFLAETRDEYTTWTMPAEQAILIRR